MVTTIARPEYSINGATYVAWPMKIMTLQFILSYNMHHLFMLFKNLCKNFIQKITDTPPVQLRIKLSKGKVILYLKKSIGTFRTFPKKVKMKYDVYKTTCYPQVRKNECLVKRSETHAFQSMVPQKKRILPWTFDRY